MAIAFYVPPEYGPQPAQQQQQQQQNHQNIIDIHAQHFAQDANNNNLNQEVQDQAPAHPSIFTSFSNLAFVREVLGVFLRNNSETAAARRSTSRSHQQQDNQVDQDQNLAGPPQLVDLLNIPSLRSFPDIVTCHAGMSFRYESRYPDEDASVEERIGTVPLSPNSSSPPSTDFEVSLKFGVSMGSSRDQIVGEELESDEDNNIDVPAGSISQMEEYRLAGARLRQIADNFQRTRQSQPPSSRNRSTLLELNVVVSFAVPTVALVGIGLYYLRR